MAKQHPADQYIEVRNLRTRYWMAGTGKACVILLHGLGGHVEDWKGNFAALAQDRRVIALDLVGFGRSDKPRGAYTSAYLMDFLGDFMDALRIRKATLIGESLGGLVALRFASEFPRRVDKLVLADSVGFGRELAFTLRLSSLPAIGEVVTVASRLRSSITLKQDFASPYLVDDARIQEDYELSRLPGAQASLLRTLRAMANFWGCRPEVYLPILDRAPDLETPTLVIWGAQDRIVPVSHARRAAQVLPHARLHIVDPCGHVPNMECPQEFNRTVCNFLED